MCEKSLKKRTLTVACFEKKGSGNTAGLSLERATLLAVSLGFLWFSDFFFSCADFLMFGFLGL